MITIATSYTSVDEGIRSWGSGNGLRTTMT